jgi:uncharacterized protein DUF6152
VRGRVERFALGIIGVLMAASPLLAHHAWAVDTSRAITLKGTVTGFEWSNPHVQILLEVKDDNGKVQKWTAGGPSPSRMAGTGWDKATLKAGDVITAVGHRATDSPNLMKMDRVVLSSGRELIGYGS